MDAATAAIVLILTIAFPGQIPDKHYRMPMAMLEDCWQEADRFMHAELPADMLRTKLPDGEEAEAVGRAAACMMRNDTERKS